MKARIQSNGRGLRVLASAYACDPRVGSEPGIGWNWVRQIASRNECWLITRENNVALVEEAAEREGLDGLHVQGFDLPYWMRFWKRGPRGAMLYFYLWQLGMARLARKLDRSIDFDVVHHLTFSSSWVPSGLAFVDKPFVWGPVGQHPRVPDRFLLRTDVRARIAEWLKLGVRRTLPKLDPFLRRTMREADVILSLGREGNESIATSSRDRITPMLACGTFPPELPDGRFERGSSFRVLYAGRLVDLKGVRMIARAFATAEQRNPNAKLELDIAGDGPRRPQVESAIRSLGVEASVRMHGHQPLERTLELMAEADVFLFPSFEGAGMVVVEAMASGCPVVCLDFGGPGEMVDETRGIKVPMNRPFDEVVSGLADALLRLANDEPLREQLARGARQWAVRNADWNRKGDRLASFYNTARGLPPSREEPTTASRASRVRQVA